MPWLCPGLEELGLPYPFLMIIAITPRIFYLIIVNHLGDSAIK